MSMPDARRWPPDEANRRQCLYEVGPFMKAADHPRYMGGSIDDHIDDT